MASSVSSTASAAGGMISGRPPARSTDCTYESGMSAAGSTQAPQLASWAYEVIPTSGFTS